MPFLYWHNMLVRDVNRNRRIRHLTLITFALLLSAINGCSTGMPPPPLLDAGTSTKQSTDSTATPSSQGTIANPILISATYDSAFVPEILSQWQEWAMRVEEATSLSFVVQPGPQTELELLEALRTGKTHIAFLTPLAYLYGHKRGWVEPAANSVESWNGRDARSIMFISRTDKNLLQGEPPQVFEQLNDKHPCYRKNYPQLPWLAPLEEYILPSGLLRLNSIVTDTPVFIGEDDGLKSVETGVFTKVCDFAAVDAVSLNEFKNMLPGDLSNSAFTRWPREMQILYTTPPINPIGVVTLSATLPQSLQTKISRAIVSIPSLYTETKLIDFNASLYDVFERIVDASGVNTKQYLALPIWTPEAEISVDQQWVAPPMGTLVADILVQGGAPFIPFINDQPINRLVIPAIYAELVRLDASGNYFPYLAADLPNLQNGLARFIGDEEDQHFEVEFALRSNVTWQDGQSFTADDLVFSWNLVMDPDWPGSHWGQAGYAPEIYVMSVDALAPDRVIYRFMSQRQAREAAQSGGKLGDASLYTNLIEQYGPVVPLDYMDVGRNVFPEHLLKNIKPKDILTSKFARSPVYAGAYRLKEGSQGDEPIVMEAFGGFVLKSPQIKQVVLGASYYSTGVPTHDVQSPEFLAQAMHAGAIHTQLGLPGVKSRYGVDPVAYDSLAIQGVANVNWIPTNRWEVLDYNLDNPHLTDLRVRRAIAYAIDRQGIIDQVLAGHGKLMKSYLPDWHPLFPSNLMLPDYAYDPNQARILLGEAGYDLSKNPAEHPTRGPLILQLASMDVNLYSRPPIATAIQEQLANINIRVEVKFYTWLEFEGQDCSAIRNGRKFDLGLAGWVGLDLYPIRWVEQTTAIASIPSVDNGCPYEKSNWSGWRNLQAEAILVQLKDGRLSLENRDNYLQQWAEHQRLWATELPSLPLFNLERPVVRTQELLGIQPSSFAFNGTEDTWNIFEWTLNR